MKIQETIDRMYKIAGVNTDAALADIFGIKPSSFSTWRMRKEIPLKQLKKFANIYNVNLTWLETGEGTATIENQVIPAMQSESDEAHRICIHQLDAKAIAGCDDYSNECYPDIIRSIWFSEQGLLEIVGIKQAKDVYLISVPTTSMEPTIKKGDIVFVDTKVNSYNGEGIYIFDLNGHTYIKRLQRIPTGVIQATSDNQNYRPFDITEELFNTAVIRGKFIRVLPINPRDL
ncbi:LexA family transcriptional regulator [Necropsobacter rosorum]|uniref:LexA family transcriptional regulator n=1 Tax=Necropsobacter rosorum TaxID=908285 RepID=UPI00068F0D28